MSKLTRLVILWLTLFVVLCIIYDIGKGTSDFSSRDRYIAKNKDLP